MADRLFDRGKFELARKEYVALKGNSQIAEDELLYRLAECSRALKRPADARKEYGELINRYPLTRHANRARLMRALQGTDDEKRSELKLLDTDKTPVEIRACALYHLGVLNNDADALARSIKLEPKGPYAVYAKFRHAAIMAEDPSQAVRRSAIRELLEIHFSGDAKLACEALYVAGVRSYSDKRYSESSSLFRRFIKKYPKDKRAASAKSMAAWSDYLDGKYADAMQLCGDGGTDDLDYLLAASAYSSGDRPRARVLMAKYLENHPEGRYRCAAELPLARMEFEEAGKTDDRTKAIEAAKRSANLSHSPADLLRLAWAYERGGLDDEAIATYQQVARVHPNTEEAADALYRKALIDVRAGRWSAAELALGEAQRHFQDFSRKAELLYWRGVSAFMLEHETEGAKYLATAIKEGLSLDQNREARLMLADRDFKEERIAEAKAAYAQLVREGACDRMSSSKIRSVGVFLKATKEGESAFDEAVICAKQLFEKADSPEWRQAAKILEGSAEELAGRYTAAIAAYRAALAESVRTEDAPEAALALGILEAREEGNREKADATLREAVQLNATDSTRRATAYLWLAKNSLAAGDKESAEAYATVVVTLFEDKNIVGEAQKLIDSLTSKERK